jgi:hypothetical protein
MKRKKKRSIENGHVKEKRMTIGTLFLKLNFFPSSFSLNAMLSPLLKNNKKQNFLPLCEKTEKVIDFF